MQVETEAEQSTGMGGRLKRGDGVVCCHRGAAMKHHRQYGRVSTPYRRANDIGKQTRTALGNYEWDLVGKSATWPEYKKMASARMGISGL